MYFPMKPTISLLLLATFFNYLTTLIANPTISSSRITVVGVVYCDTCSSNTFSRQSYFLPGVDVHVQCKFKASAPRTAEQISFTVNRTTDKYGAYKLEIPSVDGINCVDGLSMQSFCQASLIGSSSKACNIPGLKTTTEEISVKSKQDNLCIYSLNALSYRPASKNATLCGSAKEELVQNNFNSSKCFLPFFPPYGFSWPPLPKLPPFPSLPLPPLPPFTSLPFPPLPPFSSLPFPPLPFQTPPSLPFPFPPLPPFPPTPSLFSPPPSPAFNLRDPRTWIPHIPTFSPPPPPAFNLGDPRTWIPYITPSPPRSPENQTP